MKKLICILLSLILSVGILTGCDINATNDPEETPKESGSQTPAESPDEAPDGSNEKEKETFEIPYVGKKLKDSVKEEIEKAWLDTENNGLDLTDSFGNQVDGSPFTWYDPNVEIRYDDLGRPSNINSFWEMVRYYGTVFGLDTKEYHVIYVPVYITYDIEPVAPYLEVGDITIYCYLHGFDILLYNDGKFITINQAYKDGIITATNVTNIAVIQYRFEDQLYIKVAGKENGDGYMRLPIYH